MQSSLIKNLIENQKKESDFIVNGLRDAVKELPEIHQIKFGSRGMNKDVKRHRTTIKDLDVENSFR